jgi:hypothetical protein
LRLEGDDIREKENGWDDAARFSTFGTEATMRESCGNCYDTYRRMMARVYICERCGAPARECRRRVEIRHDWGLLLPVETAAVG